MNEFQRGVIGILIFGFTTGSLYAQRYVGNSRVVGTPVYSSPVPVQHATIHQNVSPVYGTPTVIHHAPGPIHGAPTVVHQSSSIHHHGSGCSHPHDPCKWSTGHDCDCKCKKCLDCFHIHMSDHCKKVECEYVPRNYEPIGEIPTIDEDKHCYVKYWDFTAKVEVPVIVCSKETCVEIDKRPFKCLPGCEFSLCVPIKDCIKKEVTCELRRKEMDIRIYRRVQDGNTSYDVYVINAASGPKSAGGMPKSWVIFHCATLSQIKAELPGITIASHAKRNGTEIAEDDQPHPNPHAAKKIELKYSVEKFNQSLASAKSESDRTESATEPELPEPGTLKTENHSTVQTDVQASGKEAEEKQTEVISSTSIARVTK